MDDLDFGATIKGFNPGQKVFNRYTLKKILGRGGMGVVWLARDEELERDIALKFLPEVVALDKEAVRDLKRETRRSLELTHSHIVRIYDFIQDVRTAAISMEYIAGDTLAARKVDHPAGHFEAAELGPWVRQLLEALGYAHTKGEVVHRDLKPANLMIDARGDLKIADFGIAASVSDSVSRVSAQAGSSGTPVYMSPQQMMGEKPAVTDDIYATGATLYELLTGKPPFYSGNVMMQVQSKLPPAIAARRKELGLEGTAVPPAWEQTIAACLAKEPADRPASAGEIAERLGLDGMAAKSTKAEAGKAGRVIPKAPPAQSQNPRSKTPIYAGIAAGVILLAGLGYYFGVYSPGQTRLAEIRRLEGEGKSAEAARLRTEQEKQDALTREQTLHLANARGGLIVRTTPTGAEVRVGAIALEKSPLTLKEQKLGKYPIRVRAEGYEEWIGEVEVKENEFTDLDVSLVRSTGTIVLSSDPTGLEVEVARLFSSGVPSLVPDKIVRTPAELNLPTDRYEVTFRQPGWPDKKESIQVSRNQRTAVTGGYVAGSLEVVSTPTGAEVWQGGKRLGTTPYQTTSTTPGPYNLELRLNGYRSQTVAGEVIPRQQLRLDAVLEKLPGPKPGQRWTMPDLNLEMMPIASGTFAMRALLVGLLGNTGESVTQVTLTRAYWLGKTEVTQAEWRAVMGTNPSNFKGDNLPVEQVSWTEAMEFCRKLTERERLAGRLPEGYTFSLPTEAQWEYACRAGTTGNYAGNLDAMGWYSQNSGNTTHPVGQKEANIWGLSDMHGNVSEWCSDWFGKYLEGGVIDPSGAASGSSRVYRGGNWYNNADNCRSTKRDTYAPGVRSQYLGFRLALVPVAQASGGAAATATMAITQPMFSDDFPHEGVNYTVQPGDTLASIGKKTGGKLADIRNANKIADESRIRVGQTIFIPLGAASPAVFSDDFPHEGVNYTVQRGDTLASMAQKLGARIEDILNANKIADESKIRVGQTLFIPLAAASGQRTSEVQGMTIKVSVLGQVKNPGQYTLEKGANLLAAIRKAGGVSDIANSMKVIIERAGLFSPVQIEVDLAKILAGRAREIPALQDGDVIKVPERLI